MHNELIHVGIMGMRWSHRKSPQEMVEKLNRRIVKTENKSNKLEKKVVKYDVKAAKLNKAVSKKRIQMDKYVIQNMTFDLSPRGAKKAKRVGRQLKRLSQRNAKLELTSARYNKRILKNKKLVAKLNTKISDININEITLGKAITESSFSNN